MIARTPLTQPCVKTQATLGTRADEGARNVVTPQDQLHIKIELRPRVSPDKLSERFKLIAAWAVPRELRRSQWPERDAETVFNCPDPCSSNRIDPKCIVTKTACRRRSKRCLLSRWDPQPLAFKRLNLRRPAGQFGDPAWGGEKG